MNKLKKYLGYLWMASTPLIVGFMVYQAYIKISNTSEGMLRTNTILQWVIILLIFIPVCTGFFIFGKYAAQEEYDSLPDKSDDL